VVPHDPFPTVPAITWKAVLGKVPFEPVFTDLRCAASHAVDSDLKTRGLHSAMTRLVFFGKFFPVIST